MIKIKLVKFFCAVDMTFMTLKQDQSGQGEIFKNYKDKDGDHLLYMKVNEYGLVFHIWHYERYGITWAKGNGVSHFEIFSGCESSDYFNRTSECIGKVEKVNYMVQ